MLCVGSQHRQRNWYDKDDSIRKLEVGEQVLVLLPSESNKLLAKWQDPYPILRKLGDVNNEVDMCHKKKRKIIFHINMFRKWTNLRLKTFIYSEEF